MLEAIIAMPENDFFNTPIQTYIWIVTNRKEERRKGKVQLIDGSRYKHSIRKNLGHKNCETTEEDRSAILNLLIKFEENSESKIVRNEEFGYWQVPIMRPKRDENGNIVLKKGKPIYAKNRSEFEQIPLSYNGGIEAYFANEVHPYDPEVIFGEPIVGYEIAFAKYFYKPTEVRSLSSIMETFNNLGAEIHSLQQEIENAVTQGLNSQVKYKKSGVEWLPDIPEHWEIKPVRSFKSITIYRYNCKIRFFEDRNVRS